MKKYIQNIKFLLFHVFILLIIAAQSATAQSVTFGFTGSPQSWTVPTCVNSITVTVAGAEGGGGSGGNGAVVTTVINVTPGDVLNLYVGGSGACPGAGWNGGAIGHASSGNNAPWNSCGGGGASDIRINGTGLANRIVVAAGGGGEGGGSVTSTPTTVNFGGSGGCATGVMGGATFGQGAPGGTQTAGGAGGVPWAGTPPGGSPGSIGNGGQGGPWDTASGGGGGGGYYGGGGGGNDGCCTGANGGGGGGGGSSLTPAGGSCTSGGNNGPGYITINYTPAASASNGGPYCVGGTIQLTGGGGTTYSWTGPNGFTSSLQNPTVPSATLASGGVYNLTVDGGACVANTTVVVVAAPTPNAGPDQVLCLGTMIMLDGTESVVANTSSWSTSTVGITPTPTVSFNPTVGFTDPAVTVNQPGVYTFTFSENNGVCPSATDQVQVTVSVTSHTTSFISPTCAGMADGSITIDNPDGVLFSYDGGTTFVPNSTQTGFVTGTYNVVSENQYGCQFASTVVVTEPLPILISAGNDTLICADGAANVWAAISVAGLNETYHWSYGGSTAATASVTPPQSITMSVYAEAANGCMSDTTEFDIVVIPLPIPQISVLNNGLCEPQLVTVNATTDPSTVGTILWQLGNGEVFTNQLSITTDTLWAGLYDVNMMIVSPEGCVGSLLFADAIDVRPQPVANFIFSPSPVMMLNTEVNFTNFSTNADSYIWNFGGGNPGVSTQQDETVQYPEGVITTYQVTLIAQSNLGCSDTITKPVQVHPEILIYAPTAFTPDDDEYNQSWQVVIEGIDIYDFTLLVYNRWGELIWESHDPSIGWDGTYGGKPVQTGTYNWKLETKDVFNDDKYTWQGSFNLLR
ncbi:MAG: T9SS type B sorting domain-containing protein [Bacteroidota bacterium]